MNEIERIASYIRSCRDANIDCTVTIDKSKTHIILNALEKQIAKKPVIYKGTNRADCPICGMTVRGIAKPFGGFCSKCGQRLDWA